MAQGTRPPLAVLGGLLLLAAIVAAALLISLRSGSDDSTENVSSPGATSAETSSDDTESDDSPADDSAADDDQPTDQNSDVPGLPADEAETVVVGSGSISTIDAYDPEGDDGVENNDLASLALSDGDGSTDWPTSCYSSEFMGGKKGVGLVVTMDGLAQSAVTVDVVNGPYIIEFYTSASDAVPATFEGWDAQLGTVGADSAGGTVVSDVPPTPVRHVLVLLEQIGRDSSCSDARPFRGRLGEVGLVG